jgi:hypothetical protein
MRLDHATFAVIKDFKIALAKTRINSDKSYRESKIDPNSQRGLRADQAQGQNQELRGNVSDGGFSVGIFGRALKYSYSIPYFSSL